MLEHGKSFIRWCMVAVPCGLLRQTPALRGGETALLLSTCVRKPVNGFNGPCSSDTTRSTKVTRLPMEPTGRGDSSSSSIRRPIVSLTKRGYPDFHSLVLLSQPRYFRSFVFHRSPSVTTITIPNRVSGLGKEMCLTTVTRFLSGFEAIPAAFYQSPRPCRSVKTGRASARAFAGYGSMIRIAWFASIASNQSDPDDGFKPWKMGCSQMLQLCMLLQ